ncbi:MAG: hypothetical protein RL563_2638 [Pseudomonadota bacterium]
MHSVTPSALYQHKPVSSNFVNLWQVGAMALSLVSVVEAGNTIPPDSLPPGEYPKEVIESLIPGQIAGQVNSSFSQSSSQSSSLTQRLLELRKQAKTENGTPIQQSSNASSLAQTLGGGAGDAMSVNSLLDERLGVYVNGHFTKGDRITTAFEKGFTMDNAGVTLGADYRLTNDWVMGLAFGYTDDNSQYDANGGRLLNRGYSGSLYGSYNVNDNWYVDSVFTYTHNDYDSDRWLLVPNEVGALETRSSLSQHQGDQQRFSVGTGYDIPMGPWTVGLRGRTEYGRVNIDRYGETGRSPFNLRVDKQFNDSVQTILGTQLSYALSMPWGVLQPQVNFDWQHEFKNNSRDIITSFNFDNVLPFVMRTNNPDRDFFTLRAGMNAVLANGISSFMQYETLLDHRYDTQHTARFGVRWDF